jgi:hypothetical protein
MPIASLTRIAVFSEIGAIQCRMKHFSLFPLILNRPTRYEAANKPKPPPNRERPSYHTIHQRRRVLPMAVTPNKDYKRREREQRKMDKRMARDAAKDQEFAAAQIAAQAAAEEAVKNNEEEIQARLEAEFEAELEAEREAQKVA